MSESKQYFTPSLPPPVKAKNLVVFFSILTVVVAGSVLVLYFHAQSHLPLTTTINGISVGNRTPAQAEELLSAQLVLPEEATITLETESAMVASNSSELGARYKIVEEIAALTKPQPYLQTRMRVYQTIKRFFTPLTVTLAIGYDETKLQALIDALNSKVAIPPVEPAVTLATSGVASSLTVEPGKLGSTIDTKKTITAIENAPYSPAIEVPAELMEVGTVLTSDEQTALLAKAEKLVGKSIKTTNEGFYFTLTDNQLVGLLAPTGLQQKTTADLLTTWSTAVNRAPQEPVFEYDKETLAVSKFVPPKNGLSLDRKKTEAKILETLTQIIAGTPSTTSADGASSTNYSIEMVLAEEPPKTPLSSLNDLGITERIGFGNSYYAHSIPNRIHNVALAASRISLNIIKPGEEYSFNKHLGEVSGKTGFKSAYVIQGNKTVLGDGGGVCQVSTTLFRAVLNAGLPVTRRLPHSYRVSYYELDRKPGIDATVYSGETDFRFKNDTGHYILIYGETDSKNLYMYYELYGTSDGRTAEIVDHKTWNFKPAPPAVYIPDPTLPVGKKVQVDWAAAGISASFKNIVKDKFGTVIREEEYVSHYRPWSAKYLEGVAQ